MNSDEWSTLDHPQPKAITLGTQIGAYRIESKLGEGGMGVVYRALDLKLNRPVAVKVLSDEVADAAARRRFQREAQTASSLNHPHILTVHDAGEFDGRQYLVTEYIDGGTLQDWAKAEKRSWRDVVELMVGVADALAAAHDAGILHRDIKLANILVTKSGYAKLADFGLAKFAEQPAPQDDATRTLNEEVTRQGAIVGTIAYMSPEQASGKPLDARSDIFSFGTALYEMLAGKRPFTGISDLEVLQKLIHQPPEPLGEDIPPTLRAIVEKALEKNLSNRYQTMRDMVGDLRRLTRQSDVTFAPAIPPRMSAWRWAMAGVGLVVVLGVGIAFWMRVSRRPASRAEWTQLTSFPDSVTQPALSPDGRMLTFIRGQDSFQTSGQIYVKLLPDGEPKQLTTDHLRKMSPVFSPDGSRIAYTERSPQGSWDTWVVPVLGGEPGLWLPNASGLIWSARNNVLFSEIVDRLEGNHMKIVAAQESRAGERDVYIPYPKGAMAHRSFPSPDGKWALLAEMTDRAVWQPCRLVPMDGSSAGRPIGPPGAACWFAAWSPDGEWTYVSSSAGGGVFHIWRQRFSKSENAPLEQITSGPTGEEGIAMAPDGRSFITAVGLEQGSVWVHDSRGERQISLEGDASHPTFSPDGKTLYYEVRKKNAQELWFADLTSGRTEPQLPGFNIEGSIGRDYDLSPDGKLIVMTARDGEGKPRLWIARVDRRSPPQPIPNVVGDGPVFGPDGAVFFRAREGTYGFVYRVEPDGTGLRKVFDYPVIAIGTVAPDGRSVVVYARHARQGEEPTGATVVLPLAGGSPIRISGGGGEASRARWSARREFLYLPAWSTMSGGVDRETFVIPLSAGQLFPKIAEGGFVTGDDLTRLPGVRVIDASEVAPGPSADVYAFSRRTVQRNLYRIPLP